MTTGSFDHDVFISHASEDKDAFVRELAQALQDSGLRVWYDEWALVVGDRLRRRINEGLKRSRFGIVVLSHNFFSKNWPQDELDGLSALEANGEDRILPIWLGVTKNDVLSYSPLLAERLGFPASRGVSDAVAEIRRAVDRAPLVPRPSQSLDRRRRRESIDTTLRPRSLVGDEGQAFGVNADSSELQTREEGDEGPSPWVIFSLVPVGQSEEIEQGDLWSFVSRKDWRAVHPLHGADRRPRSGGAIVRAGKWAKQDVRTRYTFIDSNGYVEWGRTLGATTDIPRSTERIRILRLGPLLWSASDLYMFLAEFKERFDIRTDYEMVISIPYARGSILTHLGARWQEPWDGFRDYRPVCLDDNVQFRRALPATLGEEDRAMMAREVDRYLNGVWGAGDQLRGHDHPAAGGALSERYHEDPWE